MRDTFQDLGESGGMRVLIFTGAGARACVAGELPPGEGFGAESRPVGELFHTDDHEEGVAAFLGKRRPALAGR